jgi:hypothetical protein
MLQRMNLNKNTKIWLNYLLGGIIASLLLWGIYIQVIQQLKKIDVNTLWQTGPSVYLWLVIVLMPVNLALEAGKWQLLAGSAQRLNYRDAFFSYLAGIAFSIVTPNRIGEYPGRLLYLRRKNTFRLVSVSILGAVSQLLTLFIYGSAGLIYYCLHYPGIVEFTVLIICVLVTWGVTVIYWRFEKWAPYIEKIKWLRKYHIYGKLLRRFTPKEQLTILFISLIRYAIYTAQYLFLLQWLNVIVPPVEGFFMSALFFWIIAVIPSITLVELGERGAVGLYLFHHFSENTIGILSATVGIWCINLILPSIIGSILLFRMRLLR